MALCLNTANMPSVKISAETSACLSVCPNASQPAFCNQAVPVGGRGDRIRAALCWEERFVSPLSESMLANLTSCNPPDTEARSKHPETGKEWWIDRIGGRQMDGWMKHRSIETDSERGEKAGDRMMDMWTDRLIEEWGWEYIFTGWEKAGDTSRRKTSSRNRKKLKVTKQRAHQQSRSYKIWVYFALTNFLHLVWC